MYNTIPNNPFPPSSANSGGVAYVLPVASADTLGGVKVGAGLTIENGVLSANKQISDFSTTEYDTGLKWKDGKNIFAKVVEITTDAQQGEKAYSLGLQSTDNVIDYDAIIKDSTGHVIKSCYFVTSSDCFVTYIREDNTINMVCASWAMGQTATVIVYYTKTESEG